MGIEYQVMGDDGGALAALQRAGLNPEIVGAIAAADPGAAAAVAAIANSNVRVRKVNGSDNVGIPANICVPFSAPGTNGTVAATTGAISMTATPNKNVKPTRLVLETSLPSVELTSFTIAGSPQFNGQGSVPGSAFSPFAIEDAWEFATLQGALSAVLSGTNRNAAENIIFGTLFGYSTQI